MAYADRPLLLVHFKDGTNMDIKFENAEKLIFTYKNLVKAWEKGVSLFHVSSANNTVVIDLTQIKALWINKPVHDQILDAPPCQE